MSIPVWVLDLGDFTLTCTRHADSPPDGETLQRTLLRNIAVLSVNEAAVAYHSAAGADELRDALSRVFLPRTAQALACAVPTLSQMKHVEIDLVLGRLRSEPTHARARLDLIASQPGTTCVAMTIVPSRRSNLLSAAPDMAFELDSNGVYMEVAGPAQGPGSHASELIGKSVTQTMPHEVAHRTLATLQRLRDHGGTERFEYTLALPDGLHWYEARLTALPHGGAVAYVRDITEPKSVQWQLQRSEQRFRELAECAPVMLWATSGGEMCTFCNQAAVSFSAGETGEICHGGWMRGIHPEDTARCEATFAQHLASQEPFRIEFRMRRHDGEYRWLLTHAAPRFEEGRFAGFIGASVDITDFMPPGA